MPDSPGSGRPLAAALNRACQCFPVSREGLVNALRDAPLREEHGNLVAGSAVFVGASDARAIAQFSDNLVRVMDLPGFRTAALAQAGAAAQRDPHIAGGLLGLDFHLTASGPRLIEINTNPGGVLINVEIQDALQACCEAAARWLPSLPTAETLRDRVFAVFEREWRQAGGAGAPVVAIVDEVPAQQYLSPEFRLFQALFERRGWRAVIADPAELIHRGGALRLGDTRLDLVYNRLTDFALDQPSSAALRAAWLAGHVVLTPHPRAHALHADKRLLAWLSDAAKLETLGADPALARAVAARVPPTFEIHAAEAERWWRERDHYYFKPAAGYGGKAAYAGAKLTRKTFEQVLKGGYLAQQAVEPPRRERGQDQALKYDLRAYADPADGAVLLMAAIAYWVLQQTLIASEGPASVLKSAVGGDWKGKLSPVVYLLAIASTFWVQWLAQALYTLVALLWLIPDRRIERALQRRET